MRVNDEQHWYQRAVMYGLDVKVFRDADGDGTGDFQGLSENLEYLHWLGIDALWLLPCYPSPDMDNGYDITDHYSIEPRLGGDGEFIGFLDEADRHGINVVLDLVVHHSSMLHPWFTDARKGPRSKFYDYYIWSQNPEQGPRYRPVFGNAEGGVWQFDPGAGRYYLHHFYEFEPDLNTAHPLVRNEIHRIMDYWLRLGAAGFRVDAAAFLRSDTDQDDSNPHGLLKDMHRWAAERRPTAPLIAEANVAPDQLATFLADGNEMHMLLNFLLNQYLYLALARCEAEPIARALRMLPPLPEGCQWLNFLRNMDELTLDQLSDGERDEVLAAFAPEDSMRIFGRGIRRRLAPMLNGDRRRLEMAFSLLFSLPGTPLVMYGSEIGMGDDLSLPERNPVRTPMQWSGEQPNGGFSTAPEHELVRPVISEGPFSAAHVNVADQRKDEDSLLHWMRRAIQAYKSCPEFGLCPGTVLETDVPGVFAIAYAADDGTMLAFHNLSPDPTAVTPRLGDLRGEPRVVFGDGRSEPQGSGPLRLRLDGYGYCWLRVGHG